MIAVMKKAYLANRIACIGIIEALKALCVPNKHNLRVTTTKLRLTFVLTLMWFFAAVNASMSV